MAKSSNVILIPKVPRDAFNKHRLVSELLWTQVEHLAAVVKNKIDQERQAVRTEGEASAFIKKYTAFLHSQSARAKPAPSSGRAAKKSARLLKGAGKKSTRSSRG